MKGRFVSRARSSSFKLSFPFRSSKQALHSLTDIKLSYLEGTTPGFKITFSFSENEFFTNAELEKTYYYRSEVGYGGDLSSYPLSLFPHSFGALWPFDEAS